MRTKTMTHADRIQSMLRKTAAKEFQGNGWGRRHCAAWREPQPVEEGIVRMIEAAALYADSHEKRLGGKIGEDGFLGDHWADILRNVRQLLNGELGRLDGGTVDGLIMSMLEAEDFGE